MLAYDGDLGVAKGRSSGEVVAEIAKRVAGMIALNMKHDLGPRRARRACDPGQSPDE